MRSVRVEGVGGSCEGVGWVCMGRRGGVGVGGGGRGEGRGGVFTI